MGKWIVGWMDRWIDSIIGRAKKWIDIHLYMIYLAFTLFNSYILIANPSLLTPAQSLFEVEVLTEVVDRDSIKHNVAVLTVAAKLLGLRVGVKTCTVHVQALYDYMQVPVSRPFGYCNSLQEIIQK